ncbi:MAG: hypothetical protein ACKOV8_08955, partial [Phycisphaerales bacterium]
MVVESATFADGSTVLLEGDPLQAWLEWEPNLADEAWDGMFFEWIEGSDPPVRTEWPQPWRMTIRGPHGSIVLDSETVGFVRPMFGATGERSMPPVGSPGFGDALAPGGACAVVIGPLPPPPSDRHHGRHALHDADLMPLDAATGAGIRLSDHDGARTARRQRIAEAGRPDRRHRPLARGAEHRSHEAHRLGIEHDGPMGPTDRHAPRLRPSKAHWRIAALDPLEEHAVPRGVRQRVRLPSE